MILGLALLSCGTPTSPAPGTPAASFPHPDDYRGHGAEALRDLDACVACHAIDAEVRAGPGCKSCHATYPHGAEIVSGSVHGPAWLASGEGCDDCHGVRGERPPAGVEAAVCASCHHTFPHPDGFLDVHGAAVVTRGGAEACLTCHAPERTTSGAGRCAECHEAYPHPVEWRETGAHARVADPTCTAGCHAPSGDEGPRCTSCHDLYPHPESWSAGHLAAVQVRGEAACRPCHAAGEPEGPSFPVSCAASCHTAGVP